MSGAIFPAIHSRYDIEKPVPRRLIRLKLGIINTLQEQNKKLKEQMREQQERLRQYAHEYLLMGNECITQAHDARAAIANYDKALSLDPNYIGAWIRKESPCSTAKSILMRKTVSIPLSAFILQTLKLCTTVENCV